MKKDKGVELKPGQFIEFDTIDKTPGGGNLGRAEFIFCPVIKRGIIKEVHIFRKQQRRNDSHYFVKLYGDKNTGIGFKDMVAKLPSENIAPWFYIPCAEHKSISMWIYVPNNSSRLSFWLSSIQTDFIFE